MLGHYTRHQGLHVATVETETFDQDVSRAER